MTQLYLSPVGVLLQQLSDKGIPLQGGKVYLYQAGSINTLQGSYTDSTGTTANANPIILNAAGRLANSNAPVSVWVASNQPHRMELYDSNGLFLSGGASMDNLFGINDPYALLQSLITPSTFTTPGGVDLVANAMKSFDTFASIRAAAVPNLASGQTLIVDAEGSTTPNDSLGGFFYWDPTNLNTDDGVIYLKPNGLTNAQPGRYVRQKQTGYAGTVLASFAGFGTTPTATVQYAVINNVVTMRIPQVNAISNGTAFSMIFPASSGLAPFAAQWALPLTAMQDNGVAQYANCQALVNTVNPSFNVVVDFYKAGVKAGWTATGTKGVSDGSANNYSVNLVYTLT